MPRPAQLSNLQSLIEDLGQRIGRELADAVRASVPAAVSTGGERRGRPPGVRNVVASGESCGVPGCKRARAAKGLCQNHYGKARRLNMDVGALSADQLEVLGRDGRVLRFAKAPAAALIARKPRKAKK